MSLLTVVDATPSEVIKATWTFCCIIFTGFIVFHLNISGIVKN